jgi:hypothetical protein
MKNPAVMLVVGCENYNKIPAGSFDETSGPGPPAST